MRIVWLVTSISLSSVGPIHAAVEDRSTWNGCKCTQKWSPEIPGQADCNDFCCNPDSDPYGEWCMVSDPTCEDSDWGYCRPKNEYTIHGESNCRDYEGWADRDGDGCQTYADSAWCTMAPGSAVAGVGWHDEWGTIRSFGMGVGNISAFTACCSCGGGNRDHTANQGTIRGAERHTWNSCTCKSAWTDPALGTCNGGCCNLDHDPYGDWCMVTDTECEDSDWGYCRPAGINTVYQETGNCDDVKDWKDKDGDGCKDYADNSWCTKSGGYDLGWHDEWGTFWSLATNDKSAPTACCACGGGGTPTATTTRPPISSAVFQRSTWNNCACKAYWDDASGSCSSSCCNPDDDIYGEWCLVEDSNCEDADWGYCQPTLLSNPPTVTVPGCTDKNFTDSDGDGCTEYGSNAWCTLYGSPGVGWHEEWGDFNSFKSHGETATTACCACGGGVFEGERTTPAPSMGPRQTWNGCRCKSTWSEGGSQDCTSSCCNPDLDPYGDWCIVEDWECEESDWGYCKPEGASIAPWTFEAGGCTDSPGWKDADGDDCYDYRENNWCNTEGGYNTGWHEEWGTFANFAGGTLHETANQACCACGRGKDGAQSTLGVTGALVTGRVTRNKCRCLKTWEEEGVQPRCEDYCCNPDADPDGAWCFVEDYLCEDSDWGYCEPANVGTEVGENVAAGEPTCISSPSWQDVEGDDCGTYEAQMWCTKDGKPGVGWHEEWGALKEFKSETMSAVQACCACGGGSTPIKEVPSKTSQFLVVSIVSSLILVFSLGASALYYRTNYNKILYARPGQETLHSATMGKKAVVSGPDDI